MNFKQKALNVLCRTIYKPCSIKGINDLPCIKVDADNYYFIRNTSVNVIKINNGDNLYFRECRRHTIFSEFLKELVSEFLLFGGGADTLTDEQKKVLFDAVLDKDIEKKLYEMGSVNDPTSGVYKFFYEKNCLL